MKTVLFQLINICNEEWCDHSNLRFMYCSAVHPHGIMTPEASSVSTTYAIFQAASYYMNSAQERKHCMLETCIISMKIFLMLS